MIEIDLGQYTPTEIDELEVHIQEYKQDLATLETAERDVEMVERRVLKAKGLNPGDEWVQPVGAHDSYPKGWESARNGKVWVSNVPANDQEPGAPSWSEKPE